MTAVRMQLQAPTTMAGPSFTSTCLWTCVAVLLISAVIVPARGDDDDDENGFLRGILYGILTSRLRPRPPAPTMPAPPEAFPNSSFRGIIQRFFCEYLRQRNDPSFPNYCFGK